MHTAVFHTKRAPISSFTLVSFIIRFIGLFIDLPSTERTLGGLSAFLPYVKDYVNTFMGKSITTEQWKEHLYGYYQKHGGADKIKALDSVDWDVRGLSRVLRKLLIFCRHGSMAKDSNSR